MLALATRCSFPCALAGNAPGACRSMANWAPSASPVVFGAFLFGIGMQIGGGCAPARSSNGRAAAIPRMVVTLAAFIARSAMARCTFPGGRAAQYRPGLPHPEARLDAGAGAQPRRHGGDRRLTVLIEKRRQAASSPGNAPRSGAGALPAGPWRSRPGGWRWRSAISRPLFGGSPRASPRFRALGLEDRHGRRRRCRLLGLLAGAGARRGLRESVFSDITSVMDFGIVLRRPPGDRLAGKFAQAGRCPCPPPRGGHRRAHARLRGRSPMAAISAAYFSGIAPRACMLGLVGGGLHGQHHRHRRGPSSASRRDLEANGLLSPRRISAHPRESGVRRANAHSRSTPGPTPTLSPRGSGEES